MHRELLPGRYYRIGTAYEGAINGLALEEQDLRAVIEAVIRETPAWPLVTTLAATSVTATGATLNGNVSPNGLPTTVWFEWGTDPALSNPTATNVQSAGSGTAGVSVSQPIGGMADNSVCYYRVAAQNSEGTTRGSVVRVVTGSGSGSGVTYDEGLGTVLRGVLVDSQAAAALSVPAAYFRVREFRNFADTTKKCITIGISRSYYEATLELGDPEPNLPRESEEWVFSAWDSWSYDSSGHTAVVHDLHGHTFAFDIRFGQPSAGVNTVVFATLDNVPIALSTQNYLTEALNSYGRSDEPPWYVPPN